ncbi:Stromal membrane-associated protein 2 [Cryptotermes secundus]|uniref:Stromal membrane-associated protein 2 n=1 Tax=Cryptotermes secundus TaxID=105785 RepID=A0A2J7R0Y1_9NEOP|nr:Stromal membrane-associated protein 2 [Cryptotermes secundus]
MQTMTTKAEKDRQKQIQEKCQALLTQMLRDEDNKYCVDCDAKGPRWASWNLGIFLCIRCAGIHRNLGVHISKVKSVNLDTWTPEQVVSLQQMGNSRARAVYEANLPDNFRRPQTDSSLEAFVRAKYEQKKYIAREWVPPPVPKVNWDKELDEEAERQRRRKKEAKQQQQQQQTRKAVPNVAVPQLLPKPKGSTSPKPGRTQGESNKPAKTETQDLLGLDTPVGTTLSAAGANTSGGDDIFSSFLSALPAASSTVSTSPSSDKKDADSSKGRSAEEESFFNQPAPSNQEKRQLTKDSILALYSAAPSQAQAGNPASLFGIPGGVYTQATGYSQGAVAYGMVGSPAAAIPNGIMPGTQVVQNGIYAAAGLPPQQPNLASNPFFNMGAATVGNIATTTTGFPAISQEHAPQTANQDLMLDFGVPPTSTQTPVLNHLPQQMARMNLGGAAMKAAQPQAMVGQVHSMGMQVPGMSMNIAPTVPNVGSAGIGIGAFPQSAGFLKLRDH